MKSVIVELQVALDTLTHNAPIHRAEGHHAQADLDEHRAGEIRRAIAYLQAA